MVLKSESKNYNKSKNGKKKNKSIPPFSPLLPSYLVYRNYQLMSGIQTARHDLHTRSCTPEHRDPNRADISVRPSVVV